MAITLISGYELGHANTEFQHRVIAAAVRQAKIVAVSAVSDPVTSAEKDAKALAFEVLRAPAYWGALFCWLLAVEADIESSATDQAIVQQVAEDFEKLALWRYKMEV